MARYLTTPRDVELNFAGSAVLADLACVVMSTPAWTNPAGKVASPAAYGARGVNVAADGAGCGYIQATATMLPVSGAGLCIHGESYTTLSATQPGWMFYPFRRPDGVWVWRLQQSQFGSGSVLSAQIVANVDHGVFVEAPMAQGEQEFCELGVVPFQLVLYSDYDGVHGLANFGGGPKPVVSSAMLPSQEGILAYYMYEQFYPFAGLYNRGDHAAEWTYFRARSTRSLNGMFGPNLTFSRDFTTDPDGTKYRTPRFSRNSSSRNTVPSSPGALVSTTIAAGETLDVFYAFQALAGVTVTENFAAQGFTLINTYNLDAAAPLVQDRVTLQHWRRSTAGSPSVTHSASAASSAVFYLTTVFRRGYLDPTVTVGAPIVDRQLLSSDLPATGTLDTLDQAVLMSFEQYLRPTLGGSSGNEERSVAGTVVAGENGVGVDRWTVGAHGRGQRAFRDGVPLDSNPFRWNYGTAFGGAADDPVAPYGVEPHRVTLVQAVFEVDPVAAADFVSSAKHQDTSAIQWQTAGGALVVADASTVTLASFGNAGSAQTVAVYDADNVMGFDQVNDTIYPDLDASLRGALLSEERVTWTHKSGTYHMLQEVSLASGQGWVVRVGATTVTAAFREKGSDQASLGASWTPADGDVFQVDIERFKHRFYGNSLNRRRASDSGYSLSPTSSVIYMTLKVTRAGVQTTLANQIVNPNPSTFYTGWSQLAIVGVASGRIKGFTVAIRNPDTVKQPWPPSFVAASDDTPLVGVLYRGNDLIVDGSN